MKQAGSGQGSRAAGWAASAAEGQPGCHPSLLLGPASSCAGGGVSKVRSGRWAHRRCAKEDREEEAKGAKCAGEDHGGRGLSGCRQVIIGTELQFWGAAAAFYAVQTWSRSMRSQLATRAGGELWGRDPQLRAQMPGR